MSSVVIDVRPICPMVDERIDITVTGLVPGVVVHVEAESRDGCGEPHIGWGTFEADHSGTIRVSEQAPISGSYTGTDAFGLFWSATPAAPGGARPFGETIDPLPVAIRVKSDDDREIASIHFERLRLAPSTCRIDVRDDGLVGTLFVPPGPGPHPAVLVLGGSGGGLNEFRAALLASHGFAALALAYFGYPGLPDEVLELPLEYFATAIRWLEQRTDVADGWMGVMGASKGGELSLLLASHYPQLKAVIGYVPSGFVHAAVSREHPTLSSWTINGEPLPCVQFDRSVANLDSDTPDTIRGYLSGLETEANLEQATIPVERITGRVLLITGADDALWPSPVLANVAMERLRQHDYPYPFEHLSYPNAGHAIRPPCLPTPDPRPARHAITGALMRLGGTREGNAHACEHSWRAVLNTFRASFRETMS